MTGDSRRSNFNLFRLVPFVFFLIVSLQSDARTNSHACETKVAKNAKAPSFFQPTSTSCFLTSWLYLQKSNLESVSEAKTFLRRLADKGMSAPFEEGGAGVTLDETQGLLKKWSSRGLIDSPVKTEILRMDGRGSRAKLHRALIDPSIRILVNFKQSVAYGGSNAGHWAFVADWDPINESLSLWDPDPPTDGLIEVPLERMIRSTLSRDKDNSMKIRGFLLVRIPIT